MLITARPKNIILGVKDNSMRTVPFEPASYPIFMPHLFVLAEKGKEEYTIPAPFNKAAIEMIYGKGVLDEGSKYFTSQSIALQTALKVANQCAITRVKPVGAKGADAVLYVNVVEADIPNYERNPDGSIKLDADGNKVENGTISGYKLTFVVKRDVFENKPTSADDVPSTGIGGGTLYPIMRLASASFGSFYNNLGFSLYGVEDEDFRTYSKAAAYGISLYEKIDGNPVIIKTLADEPGINISFKPKAINSAKLTYDPKYRVPHDWKDEKGESGVVAYSDFGDIYLFRRSIAQLHQALLDKELANLGTTQDKVDAGLTYKNFGFFGETADEIKANELYNVNLMGTVNGIPYTTIVLDNELAVEDPYHKLLPDINTPEYLGGGEDGELEKAPYFGDYARAMAFEDMVKVAVKEYTDPASKLRNPVTCPSNVLVDTGFTLETKKALNQAMGVRADMLVIAGTQFMNEEEEMLSPAEEVAMAEEISKDALLYPTSEFYGTSCNKVSIYGGYGYRKINGIPTPIPLSIWMQEALGAYAGSKEGRMIPALSIDEGTNKIINMENVQPNPMPETLKEKAFKVGMNYPDPADTDLLQFSSFQTVYPYDNSVLNSTVNALIHSDLIRITYKVHAEITGNTKMTKAQIREFVVNKITKSVNGKYDGRVKIEVEVIFTEADNARGFSWHTKIKTGMNVSKTVQFVTLEADRIFEDLGGN